MANPVESLYFLPWRARTPLASVDPASTTKPYTKPKVYGAPASPFTKPGELFRLVVCLDERGPLSARNCLGQRVVKPPVPKRRGPGRRSITADAARARRIVMRVKALSVVRVSDRDAGGSEVPTVAGPIPEPECPPASPSRRWRPDYAIQEHRPSKPLEHGVHGFRAPPCGRPRNDDPGCYIQTESPFENGHRWLMRRRSRLPMLRWIMASETSQRSS
jgi:hypothetical protein